MGALKQDYFENVQAVKSLLRVDENFDMIARRVTIGEDEATFF